MTMRFEFVVSVDVERVDGLFVGRDEIAEAITQALEGAESEIYLSGLGSEGTSEYEVSSYSVEEQQIERKRKRA